MRHAYLIIAHNQFDLLKKEVELLDCAGNDIFIHIDKKAKDFCEDNFKGICKHSKVTFVPRIDVRWGGLSQVEVEYILLEYAAKGGYDYYHLLSGADMPIKSNEEINAWFEQIAGKSSIGFCDVFDEGRVRLFHPFPGLTRTKFKKVSELFCRLQLLLGIRRLKGIDLAKGDNWFSITHELAEYALSKKDRVLDKFKWSLGADEFFLQTLVVNSTFKDKTVPLNRLIDWERGWPYTFTDADTAEVLASDKLFARKFDICRYPEVVEAVYSRLKAEKQ